MFLSVILVIPYLIEKYVWVREFYFCVVSFHSLIVYNMKTKRRYASPNNGKNKSKMVYIYYILGGLMLFQVGYMISSQFNYPTIFDDRKSFRYHQYQVIQDTGVHVYSQPSLLTSPTAIIKQYTTISGTGNIVPSIDDGDNTKFVEIVKNSKYVPISSNVTYRSWPNKINYLSMQYLELIVPEDKIQSGICKHAPECESKEKLAAKWGKSITLRYKQNHCCRTHTAQRYALAEIFNVLERHNIIAYLIGGSALGQRRHNKMQIPWTFDIDIGFVVDNEVLKMNTFEQILSNLVKTEMPGWTMHSSHKLDKNGNGHCAQFQLSDTKNNLFDLFGYRHNHYSKEDEAKFGTDFGLLGNCFQYARHGGKYIMPPKPCKVYDITVKCPNDIDGYIKALYGKDALSAGVDHGWDPNAVFGYDGDETFKYHLGDLVVAKVGGWDKFYPGKVVVVKLNHLYDIKFNHGELKKNVGEKSMKIVKHAKNKKKKT